MAVDTVTGALDALLTNYATGYRLPQFLSDILFPRVGVPRKGDKYLKFGREAQEKLGQSLRARGAPAQQVTEVVSDDSYLAEDHSFASLIAAEDRVQSQIGDIRSRRTALCSRRLLLDKEAEAFSLITDAAIVTQGDSLDDAAEQWIDLDNSDPMLNVEIAKEAILDGSGEDPNVMVIGKMVFSALRRHSRLLAAFSFPVPGNPAGVRSGMIGLPQLASYFGIDRVFYARGSSIDKAGTVTRFMDKSVFIGYVTPSTSMEDPSFGKSFFWEGAPNAVGGVGTILGEVGMPSAMSEEVSVHMWFGQKVTFAGAGYLIRKAGGA